MKHFLTLFAFFFLFVTACTDKEEPEIKEKDSLHVSRQLFYEIIPNSKWKPVWCRPTDYEWNELADQNDLIGFSTFKLEFDEKGNLIYGDKTTFTDYNEQTGYIENLSGRQLYYVASLSEDRLVICLKGQGYLNSFDAEAGLSFRTVAYRIVYERM